MTNQTTTQKIKIHRIAPGRYQTTDGRYTVQRIHVEAGQYGPAQTAWYWQEDTEDVHDWHCTKAIAIEALQEHLNEVAAN